ncbi:MAG: response regulator transcription factor [Myxococcales bacterium]|nr:response regulator transcription factor [Myxococcales bacterium]
MARVLVIEDEADLREILEYNLTQEGHRVQLVSTGAEGLRVARELHPDLILLDLMLPDMSGTAVCKTIKKDQTMRDVRVIMVTAKGEEIDRVVGFELGADDYVVKPFSVRELLLRVSAVLRRKDVPQSDLVEFGELRVDPAAHRVWVAGAEIALTSLEFKLLLTLYERKNRVQTRSVLLNDIWGIEADITTRTVDTHVKRLREKLKGVGQYIETVRGVGYRFTEAPVEEEA